MNFWWFLLISVIKIAVVLGILLMAVAYTVLLERKVVGRIQNRWGPSRVGPFGLLQAVADAVKVLLKENIVPTAADHVIHWLAPLVAFVPVLLIFTVIPFQNGAMLADLNIGILFIVAISSISTVGVFMAGWASSNKYSLLGAMRNVAAVVSYEIPLALALVSIVIVAGTMSMNGIVLNQNIPNILTMPLAVLIFFIAGSAEINRSPFDLMEADSDIVAGFHTEYSGMKFAMFYLVEYAEAIGISAIIATLFLSGWRGPVLPAWLWVIVKIIVVFFFMVWVRTTMPRVRIDQLMGLAWKFLFPLAIINLFITAIEVLGWPNGLPWVVVPINFAITGVLILLFSKTFKLGFGRSEV